nr:RNA-directed DNA polymerase, eukaryota [Tanacetum cinerariifolium]
YKPEILYSQDSHGRDYKPAVQHQRRVNPKIHDVIKKEVEKLLDAVLIYPISDTPWETKMEKVDLFNTKACWGNINFDYVVSPSVGNSGGILCVWDPNLFYKENSMVSDYFIAIMGNWLPNNKKWNGEVLLMGDFNEVRLEEERYGSIFNSRGAAAFNSFIVDSGLVKVPSGAGSESRPPMLNKENYVPWSFRLLWYAKSRPNGKLIHNSILNGPYVRKMVLEPGDANREITVTETFHLQTDDELFDKELKQIEADDQVIQTILLGLPEDIYAAVDSCKTA